MKSAIEEKLQDLFIADSDLDDIKVFIRGEPIVIPLGDYPACIIFLSGQTRVAEETGLWIYHYDGYIAVETQTPDKYIVNARKATIESYGTVRTLLDAITDNLESNLSLENLVSGSETVRVIDVGDKVYGLTDRGNTLANRGEIPISIETQKTKA